MGAAPSLRTTHYGTFLATLLENCVPPRLAHTTGNGARDVNGLANMSTLLLLPCPASRHIAQPLLLTHHQQLVHFTELHCLATQAQNRDPQSDSLLALLDGVGCIERRG